MVVTVVDGGEFEWDDLKIGRYMKVMVVTKVDGGEVVAGGGEGG